MRNMAEEADQIARSKDNHPPAVSCKTQALTETGDLAPSNTTHLPHRSR